jgi:putative ABC transport system permease protein
MFSNYLKITFRNLARNKTFSFINIFGLAAGLATCLLIMLYIKDEASYDQHHINGDRVYRVAFMSGANKETWAAAPAPLAWALKNDLPEVEEVTRLLTLPEIQVMTLKVNQPSKSIQFIERNGYYVDSTFFRVFTYDFIHGNPASALSQPNSIVISGQIANKFFGKENPIGRTMVVVTPFGEMNYTVNGVFDNTRNKSHIPANYLLSMRNRDMGTWVDVANSWASNNIFHTYARVKEGTERTAFEKKLTPWFDHHAGDLKAAGINKALFLQPLRDIYLRSNIGNEIAANGNITYLYILGSIAAFILLIACINFMNLSTARSERRAKEVGVRKVMGVRKSELVYQFLGESLIMCIIAMMLALVLVSLFLPYFNTLTQKNLQPFDQPDMLIWIGVLTLVTGLLAGLYPAFYLSAFRPVAVLKGKIINHFSAIAIRKGLVVFQFTVSICLIFGAIVIWQQLNYLGKQQLGFNKNQQLILPLTLGFNSTESNYTALKNEMMKMPQVRSVTGATSYPGATSLLNDMLFYAEGKTARDIVDIHLSAVQHDYIETLGFKLLHGRTFSADFRADSNCIILNETAIKNLGYDPATAVGKKIYYDFASFHGHVKIIGVMKDFHFESLHSGIKPYGFTSFEFGNRYNYLVANLKTNNYSTVLADVEKIWKKVLPQSPFNYSFLDQDFQHNYEKDQLTSSVVLNFTVITILIACLGLFGLAAFSAEQRTREIGIRKVLGASVANVAALLSKDFIRLVLIAIVIASPLAWYVMNQWLQNFAYKVEIGWWMFAATGGLAIFIALATVSFQAIKSALANPVKSLRPD